MIRLPVQMVSACLEWPLSRRALSLAFLLGAVVLVLAPWLRPPLSPDVRSIHLPLGLGESLGRAPEALLSVPRQVPVDSVGVGLLLLIAVGALLVLWRPRWLAWIAGLLLAVSVAANAAVLLNHPALIESLDLEYAQRQQMVTVAGLSPEPNPGVKLTNGRIGLLGAPLGCDQPGDLTRGWVYALYGSALVLWATVGLLLGTTGALSRRLGCLMLWALFGVGLSGLVCWRRLHAEYYWMEAQRLEADCDYAACRQALETAVATFPDFRRLQRTWLLAGKLDYRQGRGTSQQQFFRAYQLARDKGRLRAVTYAEDLPWLTPRTPDYREGLATLPAGFNLNLPPGTAEIGTADFRAGFMPPRGPLAQSYHSRSGKTQRQALDLMEELLVREVDEPAVRHQAARLWIDRGLEYYGQWPVITESGLDYALQKRCLTAAHDSWCRAAQLTPGRHDCNLYLGLLQVRLEPEHPDRAEATLAPLLGRLGDQIMRADIFATLGDAYFAAGQPTPARKFYAESFGAFALPTQVNYRAQKGLGGL